ncbi:ATP-binding cassette domain-containing protein [Thauera mechernichensis]
MSIIERAVSKARREDQAAVEDAEGLIHQPVEHDVAHDVAGPERDAVPASQASAAAGDGAPDVDAVPAASGVELAKAGVQPLLRVEDLRCAFDVSKPFLNRLLERAPRRWLKAVDGVSFDITRGETFALVGESGCGKLTVARLIVGLYEPSAGRIVFDGHDLALVTRAAERQKLRRRFQMIFQDPYASLNPRWRVERIIAEPIRVFGLETEQAAIRARVAELLTQVGLSPADGAKYPHEFSGGQRQRICIARALANRPEFLVCDEPTSALDVSVQAQILNLMRDLQDALGLTYLFISHDLAVVRHMANEVGVMYLGRIVEIAASRTLFERPRHPYTRMLLATIPSLEMRGQREDLVRGEVPNPITPPPGCSFHPRCPLADARCRSEAPALRPLDGGQRVACHAVEEGREGEWDGAAVVQEVVR